MLHAFSSLARQGGFARRSLGSVLTCSDATRFSTSKLPLKPINRASCRDFQQKDLPPRTTTSILARGGPENVYFRISDASSESVRQLFEHNNLQPRNVDTFPLSNRVDEGKLKAVLKKKFRGQGPEPSWTNAAATHVNQLLAPFFGSTFVTQPIYDGKNKNYLRTESLFFPAELRGTTDLIITSRLRVQCTIELKGRISMGNNKRFLAQTTTQLLAAVRLGNLPKFADYRCHTYEEGVRTLTRLLSCTPEQLKNELHIITRL